MFSQLVQISFCHCWMEPNSLQGLALQCVAVAGVGKIEILSLPMSNSYYDAAISGIGLG